MWDLLFLLSLVGFAAMGVFFLVAGIDTIRHGYDGWGWDAVRSHKSPASDPKDANSLVVGTLAVGMGSVFAAVFTVLAIQFVRRRT
jgi:hypothetical protein